MSDDENTDVAWVAAKALIAIGESGLEVLFRNLVGGPTVRQFCKGTHQVLPNLYKR